MAIKLNRIEDSFYCALAGAWEEAPTDTRAAFLIDHFLRLMEPSEVHAWVRREIAAEAEEASDEREEDESDPLGQFRRYDFIQQMNAEDIDERIDARIRIWFEQSSSNVVPLK